MSERIVVDKEVLKRIQKYDADLEWFQNNYKDLKKSYKGQYVAIQDELVIAANEDLKELLEVLKGEDVSKILIEYVNDAREMYVL